MYKTTVCIISVFLLLKFSWYSQSCSIRAGDYVLFQYFASCIGLVVFGPERLIPSTSFLSWVLFYDEKVEIKKRLF